VIAGLMTCNSPVWAAAATRELGSPDTKLIRTGNPRQLAFRTTPDPSSFERLGLRAAADVVPEHAHPIQWPDQRPALVVEEVLDVVHEAPPEIGGCLLRPASHRRLR